MLQLMFLILLFITILFFLIMLQEDNDFWSFVLGFVVTVLWWILAIGCLSWDEPYTIFNVTSGNIESGIANYVDETNAYLSGFFSMMGVITMIYMVIHILGSTIWKELKQK